MFSHIFNFSDETIILNLEMRVLDGSSRRFNAANMPPDRAEANQGVGKVPKPVLASL